MQARLDAEAPGEPFRTERIERARLFLECQRAWLNGNFERADGALSELLEHRFEWMMSDCMLLDRAELLTQMGRYDEAAALLQPILDRNPRHPEVNLRAGIAMARAGRHVAAASHCAMALASWGNADPGHRLVSEAQRVFEEALRKSARTGRPSL
jgi:tetratricopeptide (TPR) repeat protein